MKRVLFSFILVILVSIDSYAAKEIHCSSKANGPVVIYLQRLLTDIGAPKAYELDVSWLNWPADWHHPESSYPGALTNENVMDRSDTSRSSFTSYCAFTGRPCDRYGIAFKKEFIDGKNGSQDVVNFWYDAKPSAKRHAVVCTIVDDSPAPILTQNIDLVRPNSAYSAESAAQYCATEKKTLPTPRDFAHYAQSRDAVGILESSIPKADRWYARTRMGDDYVIAKNPVVEAEIDKLREMGFQPIYSIEVVTNTSGYYVQVRSLEFYYNKEGYVWPFNRHDRMGPMISTDQYLFSSRDGTLGHVWYRKQWKDRFGMLRCKF